MISFGNFYPDFGILYSNLSIIIYETFHKILFNDAFDSFISLYWQNLKLSWVTAI